MNPPSPKRQRVSESFESVRTASSGEKVRFLKQVSETVSGLPEFVSSGGIEMIGDWLSAAVESQETGLVHACLGALEKIPMNFDLLQKSKIGRIVNESLKNCQNQVAVDRARKLINEWKRAVGGSTSAPAAPKRSSVTPVEKKTSPDENNEIIIPKGKPESPLPSQPQPQEDSTVSALASLLESLPDLDALVAEAEIPVALKKRICWKPDTDLVQMVEFGITESCLELRRTIDETHGGLSALHPHGQDTDEDQKRFLESRRKERAMGGERLKHMSSEFADFDDDIEPVTERFVWPFKIKLLISEAVHDTKKLKSYERQDLADIHGPRSEVIYASDIDIPDFPSEPSTSVYRLQHNSTVDIQVPGVEVSEVEEVEPQQVIPVNPLPPPMSIPVPVASFDDEFVRLNSKLQTAILDSEDLLRLFTTNPILLRDLTMEKLSELLPKKVSAVPPSTTLVDDRKSWGVSTIRSSVRNQVMTAFQPPAYHSGGFVHRDRSPSFERPTILPPVWPPHGQPPSYPFRPPHHIPPPASHHAFQGFMPPVHPPEGHPPDGFFHPQGFSHDHHGFHETGNLPQAQQRHDQRYPPRHPQERIDRAPYRPPTHRY